MGVYTKPCNICLFICRHINLKTRHKKNIVSCCCLVYSNIHDNVNKKKGKYLVQMML